MNNYEQRKQDRIERYERRAEKASSASDAAFNAAHDAIKDIPPGQPILVGHHSEKRHRSDLDKHDQRMRRGFDEKDKAEHYADKADAAASRTDIDSDDPDAPEKLRERIDELKAKRERMKATNAAWRKGERPTIGPFQPYELSNLGAKIKRLEKRLQDVEVVAQVVGDEVLEWNFGAVTIEADRDEGRVFVRTPGRDEEATKLLRSRGFNWSRRSDCWSRKLTTNALYVCKREVGPGLERIYDPTIGAP